MSLVGSPFDAMPTRSQIESWDYTHLLHAAERWRKWAENAEELFDQHRKNVAEPGGSEWAGDAKDAALQAVTADLEVVSRQLDALSRAETLASNGASDVQAAKRDALEVITQAEADSFRVEEDLSVRDIRPADVETLASRRIAAMEHAESVRWSAEQLLATDSLVARRLTAAAAELEGIRFQTTERDDATQLLDNNQVDNDAVGSGGRGGPGEKIGFAGGWQFPWDPPPPSDSAPGGGHWEITGPAYASGPGGGPPMGPFQRPAPWRKNLAPVTGPSSGFQEVVAPPPNGWGAKPAWTMQEAYKFRIAGEGFSGAPDHVQWVQRNDKWYQATWISYDFEAEHVRSMIPHNDAAGYMRIPLGLNEWRPIDIKEIYRTQIDNPRLTLYLPTPLGGTYELPADQPRASVGR
ncbi:EspA/EspE family type VII secretion system effector [Mycolicibacterium thermoresistibile]